MSPDTEEKLKEIFSIVLDQPETVDFDGLRRINCPKWDSLATVSLVAAVESEFGLEFSTEQRERFTSYQSVSLLITELAS
ncbi:MAG TPA: hypothetical protein DCG48_12395 [Rhodospirillaceae bacterium]|nr:hypothetical protein [Rhodospirillaceae bacterium]|tara:strand:+ start:16191 stop:16430 length:240 start_codon:yes stop_codon:yes gene_type:complete